MTRFANNPPSWTWCAEGAPGAVAVVEEGQPGAGTYRETGGVLFDRDGAPVFQGAWVAWAPDDERAELQGLIQAQADAVRLGGCPVDFGGVTEHLQMRDDTDLIRWTNLRLSAFKMKMAGMGAEPMVVLGPNGPEPMPIKTAENVEHVVTVDQADTMMDWALSWNGLILKREWALKTDLDAASLPEHFDDIRAAIATGWPS